MLTLLHVEDELDDASLFAAVLQCVCAEVLLRRVLDGKQAIDYLEGRGPFADRSQYPFPDLVVLDWKMPNLGGAEFLHWRDASRFSTLPVAILTGAEEESDLEEARNSKALMVFTKPFGIDALGQIVEQICNLASRKHF